MAIIDQNPEIKVFLGKAVENYVTAVKKHRTYMSVHECYKMYDELKKATSVLVALEVNKCRIELFDSQISPVCESAL